MAPGLGAAASQASSGGSKLTSKGPFIRHIIAP